jgi:hypothetical protein
MATFDESQVTSLAEIFGQTSDYMGQWLDVRASIITDADKTAILADITSYQAVETDYVDIMPNIGNKGAKLSPDKQRSLIRNRIGSLIGWQVSSSNRLVRA